MIYRGDEVPTDSVLNYDVVIVGSGAGGAMAAALLAKQGLSVVVLEEGPYVDKQDFNQDESKLVKMMYRRGGALATDDMSIRILQGRVLGGSTTINWMNSFRTPNGVLEEWIEYFGLDEYSPKAMEPHFKKIEERMSIHKVPDHEHSPQNRIILKAGENLGIHAEACSNNSNGCIGCGKCGLGCYYDAKMDMRLTYLKDAVECGADIFTDSKVEKITYISPNCQNISAVVCQSKGLKIQTRRTVVAGGAIMTPLLLQNSKLTRSKQLGNFLHLHPVSATIGVYEEEIHPTYGAPHTVHSSEWADLKNGYGVRIEPVDLEVFLIGVNAPGIGKERFDIIKQLNHLGVLLTLVRDGVSRKSNGSVRWKRWLNLQGGRFSFRKLPSIQYRIDPLDHQHLLFGLEKTIKIHLAAGAKEVIPTHSTLVRIKGKEDIQKFMQLPMGPNQLNVFSAHPTGTARMGKHSSDTVVDETMQMHHYPGVYIMDGSVLPTSTGVNPMETILAVVSRAIELGNVGF